jgi:hypothetical protein
MAFKLDRVGTPDLSGTLDYTGNAMPTPATPNPSHPFLSMLGSPILARSNAKTIWTGSLSVGAVTAIAVTVPVSFSEDALEDVFEFNTAVQGAYTGGGLTAYPFVATGSLVTANVSGLIDDWQWLSPQVVEHPTDSVQMASRNIVSIRRSTDTDVGYVGYALVNHDASASSVLTWVHADICVRKWAPAESTYPDYPDPKSF